MCVSRSVVSDSLRPREPQHARPPCQCRRHKDESLTPWSGRSPGGGPGNPLQYSCLENPVDRGAWRVRKDPRVAHQAPLSMGILQARILEWVASPFSRGSSQPRDCTVHQLLGRLGQGSSRVRWGRELQNHSSFSLSAIRVVSSAYLR